MERLMAMYKAYKYGFGYPKFKSKYIQKLHCKIRNATVSRDKTGKYYVSLVCEILPKSLIENPKFAVGIDIGIKNLVTLSDCTFIKNNHYAKKFEKRIDK